MKTKILKRILAAIIAFSWIMMAPGFSSAVKKVRDLTKKQAPTKKQLKQNADPKTGGMGQNQSGEKIHKNKQAEQDQKNNQLEKFEDLLKKPLKTSLEKKDFVKTISDLAQKNSIQNHPQNIISKTISKLLELISDKDVACCAAEAVDDLINLTDWPKNCSKDEALKIISGLTGCFGNKSAEENATSAINGLASNNDWAKNCSEEEIFKILDVFGKFVGRCADKDALRNIVCAVSNLMYENDDIKECYRAKIPEMLNMFCECAKYESSQEDVACAIDSFMLQGLFSECLKSQSMQIVYILEMCTNGRSPYFVSSAIFEMASQGAFKDWFDIEILKMISRLNFCVLGDVLDGQEYVAKTISELAQRGLMSQILKKDMVDVTNLLAWLCEKGKADFMPDAAEAFRVLASNGLIDSFDKGDMLRITDALAKCAEGCKNSKKHVSRAILEFSKRNLLFSYSKEEIQNILNLIDFCAANQDAVENVSNAILVLAKKSLLKNFSKEEIFKISSKLSKYAVCDGACGKSVQETARFLNEIAGSKI